MMITLRLRSITLFYLGFLFLIYSCKENDASKISSNSFQFEQASIDTVFIDSGDELIQAAVKFELVSLLEDHKYLYHWDQNNAILEVIDLDELALVNRIPFEKEGPNGTGVNPFSHFQMLNESEFVLSNPFQVLFFNMEGEKLKDIDLYEEKLRKAFSEVGAPRILHFDEATSDTYGFQVGFKKFNPTLNHFNLESYQGSVNPLAKFNALDNYRLLYESKSGMDMKVHLPTLHFNALKDKILISSDAIDGLYVYNLKETYLEFYNLGSQVATQTLKSGPTSSINDFEEWQNLILEMEKEFNYGKFLFDEQNDRYLRLLYRKVSADNFKIFVSEYSLGFDLLREYEVAQTLKKPKNEFVKDGSIWLYQNFDDELAFIKLTLN
jgi:hypothetical protein